MVPHRVVHAQANEPTEQQVVVDLLHQQPLLRADGEEYLQQAGPAEMDSGAIDGRPDAAYSPSNSSLNDATPSVNCRTLRNR